MPLIKQYGQCGLHDGGYGRRILHIPRSLFDNLIMKEEDRDRRDTVARLFAKTHNGSYPIWAQLYESVYAVEMRYNDTDIQIAKFVKLIEKNQVYSTS
ncbi:MAG: hypothetical protein AAB795_01910 [Patescibacteria group bacterium]